MATPQPAASVLAPIVVTTAPSVPGAIAAGVLPAPQGSETPTTTAAEGFPPVAPPPTIDDPTAPAEPADGTPGLPMSTPITVLGMVLRPELDLLVQGRSAPMPPLPSAADPQTERLQASVASRARQPARDAEPASPATASVDDASTATPATAQDDRQKPAEAPPAARDVRPPAETFDRTEPAPAVGPAPVPEARPAVAAAKPAVAHPVEPPLPVEQVPMRIAKAAAQHEHRITIRLDPPDLGRVDIVLDTRRDVVHVAMAVERADTLELLRRDAPLLDQALARGSLKLDGNLEFSLQQGLQQRPGGQHGDGRHQPYAAYPERGRDAAEPGSSVGPARPAHLGGDSIDIIV
jgi:hypothetical protein